MPRAVKDPMRKPITREHVLNVFNSYGVRPCWSTARDLAREARWLANGAFTTPPMNERDIEIVHGILRSMKAEGVAETCGTTKTEKGSGKPPLLWRLVRHG